MSNFSCPLCKSPLTIKDHTYKCNNNHCFDIAKQGYVNLLCSQSPSGSHHGDDKLMVKARRNFLELGYYENLRSKLTEEILNEAKDKAVILDAGCGEGWYTEKIANSLHKSFRGISVIGVDISKDAVTHAARKSQIENESIEFAVASAFSLPVQDSSVDVLISIFAPLATKEFSRVLKPGGTLFLVVPREKHLIELKKAIYEDAYENPPESEELEGFELIENIRLDNSINLKTNEEIEALFMMTPYYYKTSKKDQKKLSDINTLNVTTEFSILKYTHN